MKAIYVEIGFVDQLACLMKNGGHFFLTPQNWSTAKQAQCICDEIYGDGLMQRPLSISLDVDLLMSGRGGWENQFLGGQCRSMDDARCIAIEVKAGAYFFAVNSPGDVFSKYKEALFDANNSATHEGSFLGSRHKGHDGIRAVFRSMQGLMPKLSGFQIWRAVDVTGIEGMDCEFIITGDENSLVSVFDALRNSLPNFLSEFDFGGGGVPKLIDLPNWVCDWESVVKNKFSIF